MNFYLMNKNVIVAEFVSQSMSGVRQIVITTVYRPELLPLSLKNGYPFTDWLGSRLVLSHRTDILTMFKQLGITEPEDILTITKGISLNDTFWVKRAEENITWDRVSPYTNHLNKNIADYSFDNTRKVNRKAISSSPDFATSGQFPKCWKRINNVIYMIKGGSIGHRTAGNEPFSEVNACLLADFLKFNHIHYDYIEYRTRNATKCANMCNESIGIYPFNEVYPQVNSYEEFLSISINRGEEHQALDMLLLDYLILNPDRHLANISYFVNNDTQEILGITPIYDNNLALLPTYSKELDKNIDSYINGLPWKFTTRLNTSFEDLFRMIDCKYVREKVSSLKNFRISSKYKRSDIANRVLKRQLSLIPNK